MGKFDSMDGRAILSRARQDIVRAGVEMSVVAEYDHLPAEHRARVRRERTHAIRSAREEATNAVTAWAEAERASAKKRLAARPVGTAAEESRRVADELRIGRIVEAARAGGNARGTAVDLAQQASARYALGDLDEASVLARAAVELGGPGGRDAGDLGESIQLDRDLADPAKASAIRDLRDVDVVLAAFDRDVNAAYAQSMQDSAALARALGDGAGAAEVTRDVVQASLISKAAAKYGADQFGGAYAEPEGVLSGKPTGDPGGRLPGGLA